MYLAVLWHFHQPIYRNPGNGEYILPWVNYHALKNYYQMALLVKESEFPCTFNFVPCLLEQMADYAEGKAVDPYLEAFAADARKLTSAEVKLLQKFVPSQTDSYEIQLKAFQSFFSPLVKLGQEKEALFDLQAKIHQTIIPLYKSLQKKGTIEITTSPYYHPLLPLIFDITSASEEKLPSLPFHHPEDGEVQIEKGREYFKSIFGYYPLGFWPSEGGLSQEVAQAISKKGFSYAVTDENILWKSLNQPSEPKTLYRPYLCEKLSVFFRDRELSDLLSFEYQKWDEKEAVGDLVMRLEERKKQCAEDSICAIVLDGENPWEHYRQNGILFLREFYKRLKQIEGILPINFRDYLVRHKPGFEIKLVPGTWQGSFSKWVGIASKNKAWDILSRARELCGAREEILIAEGSDWFWWYGEEKKDEFDFLFKSYIQKAYELSGIKWDND